jgi:hypothetical protein
MYINQKSFASEKVMGHSLAAAVLCNWVKAVDNYIKDKQKYKTQIYLKNDDLNIPNEDDKSVMSSELRPMESSRSNKFEHIENLRDSIR